MQYSVDLIGNVINRWKLPDLHSDPTIGKERSIEQFVEIKCEICGYCFRTQLKIIGFHADSKIQWTMFVKENLKGSTFYIWILFKKETINNKRWNIQNFTEQQKKLRKI